MAINRIRIILITYKIGNGVCTVERNVMKEDKLVQ